MKDNWLKDLQGKLADYEREAPDMLWENIEKQLQSPRHKRNAHVWTWRKYVAAAILLLLICSSYFLISQTDIDMSVDNHLANIGTSNIDIKEHSKPVATHEGSKGVVMEQHNQPRYKNHAITDKTIAGVSHIAENADTISKVSDQTDSPITPTEIESTEKKDIPQKRTTYRSDMNVYNHIAQSNMHNNEKSRFSMGIYTSGSPDHSSAMTSQTAMASSLGADNANWEDDPKLGIMLFNKGKATKHNVKHHLPVRTGISFAYKLNDRLSIESGLTYTNLTSDFKEGTDNNYINNRQSLHYIGIPVSVRYNIFSWKLIDIYGAAGVHAEQCVKGQQKTDYIIEQKTDVSETYSIDEKPFQFSVNASAGVQLNATSLIGIYAEPGVSYHFKDNSTLQTIYSDKPFNFNLNIGIRFTFGK